MLGDWYGVEDKTCVRRLNVELRYVSSRLFHPITLTMSQIRAAQSAKNFSKVLQGTTTNISR